MMFLVVQEKKNSSLDHCGGGGGGVALLMLPRLEFLYHLRSLLSHLHGIDYSSILKFLYIYVSYVFYFDILPVLMKNRMCNSLLLTAVL